MMRAWEKRGLAGPRLRAVRLQRGESLASGAVLRKLAHYYGLNVLDFFSPVDAAKPLVRRSCIPATVFISRGRRRIAGSTLARLKLLSFGSICRLRFRCCTNAPVTAGNWCGVSEVRVPPAPNGPDI
jgi:hypothetical protein